MSIAGEILHAEHVGIREMKVHLSMKFLKKTMIITEHGKPVSVNLPYEELMELVDILDELADPKTLQAVADGRREYLKGAKGVPVERLLSKYRKKK